jgi:hypothetical protein
MMAFETIENVKPSYYIAANTPKHGIAVSTRRAPSSEKASAPHRYIVLKIGADLAKAVRFHAEKQEVRLMFGTGPDAGKVQLAMQLGGGLHGEKTKIRRVSGDDKPVGSRWAVCNRVSTFRRRSHRSDPARKRAAPALRVQGVGRDARGVR